LEGEGINFYFNL